MVDRVGGLRVRIPFRMQDPFSGSNFHPGFRRLHGKQVLAFARDRNSVASGDFGRQENGGRVFMAALTQFRTEYRKNPSRLLAWIAAGARNMDTDLPLGELVDLAFTASGIRSDRRPQRGPPRRHRVRRRTVGGDAVDGDGPRDLPRREGGRRAAAGQHPSEPDRGSVTPAPRTVLQRAGDTLRRTQPNRLPTTRTR